MARKKYYSDKKPSLSLIQQKVALCLAYPESKVTLKKNGLLWSGNIRPTPLSKEYKLLIDYNGLTPPETWVIGDELKNLDHSDFPHKYHVDPKAKIVRICLFLPGSGEWTKQKTIARTIVPWAIEWLYFYEIWLATGEWCGGGQHPKANTNKNDQNFAKLNL